MLKNVKLFSALSLAAVALSVVPFNTVFAATSGEAVLSGANGNGGTSAGGSATDGAPASQSGDIGVGFTQGDLILNQVPNFDFGYHTIGESATYDLLSAGNTPKPGNALTGDSASAAVLGRQLVVSDKRGTNTGWSVTVGVASPIGSGATVLSGADVTFTSKNIQYGLWAPTLGPKGEVIDGSGGGYYFNNSGASGSIEGISAKTPVTLPLDVATSGSDNVAQGIFGAPAGATADPGTYALDFTDKTSAQISVPTKSQKVGVYTGKLVWTLSTAPQ
ncbi:WxL domain-containing protein [Schleiferilactobacillus harbinensis]|uniref:WxL domain-containing protein n=1 Tax=Schleiferilactobacillus harbinensis TaxID=304207 RepID=UPI00345EEF55